LALPLPLFFVDMHLLEERFLKSVKSLNEGQLLQRQDSFTLTASKVESFDLRIVVGRGEVHSFWVFFTGDISDMPAISYSVLVNGKEVNADLPALASFIDTGATSLSQTTGTARIVKTMFKIPEGAKMTVRVTTGALGQPTNLFMNQFFTNKFFPKRMPITLIQNFEAIYTGASQSVNRFNIPARRGRIVGLSIFTNIDSGDLGNSSGGMVVLINGVTIIENVSEVQFLTGANMLETNNWIVNIKGGGVLTVSYNNRNGEDVRVGITLFFSELLSSKTAVSPPTKQRRITGG